jgi:capsular exopolysaccharide synthesis family protein
MTKASVPGSAAFPKPRLALAVTFVASLLLGIAIAIARELMNPKVSGEDELIFAHRLPVLTRIPRLHKREVRAFLVHREPVLAHVTESFRTLRANLAFTHIGSLPRTILVASAISGEGKTFAASNLAIAIAAGGERVALVDGDLRRPMLATVFGVASGGRGLLDVLLGNANHEQALVPAPGYPNLRLLLSSWRDADLVDLIELVQVERTLEQLKNDADVIIIDSSPLTEVSDALKWAGAVDAILVTVRIGWSQPDKLEDLRRTLAQRRLDPAGFIVTTKERARKGEYYRVATDLQKVRTMASSGRTPVEGGEPDWDDVEHG